MNPSFKADLPTLRPGDSEPARLRQLFERMPIACIVFDAQLRITEWNPAAEAIFGYRREEVLGREGPLVLLSPRSWRRLEEVVHRLLAGDMAAHSVNENLTRDGRTIVCEWYNTPLRDADGEVIGLLSMAQDVTERTRTEEALRASEERYRTVISQAKDYAIFSTDGHGVVTTWNEGCQQVFGYPDREFVGLHFDELFTSAERSAGIPSAILRQTAETGTVIHERWMRTRGGHRFFAVGTTAALTGDAGDLVGFSTVLRDHTEMKQAQDHLERRCQRLERQVMERTDERDHATERLRIAERMASMGTLSAGLGHDLGNLLLSLEARLGVLERADLLPELHEQLSGIRTCANYLERLASGLRLLTIDPSEPRGPAVTELGAWWRDVGVILKDIVPRGIRFEHDLPTSGCWVAIGRAALTQAVYNLVQNAVDSLRDRGPGRIRVLARPDAGEETVRVCVTDDGRGMSDGVLRRCLEPNFSTKPGDRATGMGLFFVHRLVIGAGGRVEITSSIREGTTACLVLPRPSFRDETDAVMSHLAFVDLPDPRTQSFTVGMLRTLDYEVVDHLSTDREPCLFVVGPEAFNRIGGNRAPGSWVIVVGDADGLSAATPAGTTMVLPPDSSPSTIRTALCRVAAEIDGAAESIG